MRTENAIAGQDEIEKGIKALAQVRSQIGEVIVGQSEVVELTLLALLIEGHVLLEGVPGLGKTLLVKTLADTLSLHFSRIQFTPDLMPADVLGSTVIVQSDKNNYDLRFEQGPIFANLLLADEINRASPKTQSALLEAMQERSVTVRGTKYPLPRPSQVLATQNPLEMEGTYPLPEAQIDRFAFKILIAHPSQSELIQIVEKTVGTESLPIKAVMDSATLETLQRAVREIVVPSHIFEYAARLTMASLPEQDHAPARVKKFVRYGAGPRGTQTLVLAAKARALMQGRFHVCLDDLRSCVTPVLRHRIALNFDGQTENISVDTILADMILAIDGERDWEQSIRPE